MSVFGIYTNLQKDEELLVTRRLAAALESRGVEYYFDARVAKKMGSDRSCEYKKIDILFVLGGDGTMLAAAREYAVQGTKLLGLNLGRLGFLLDMDYSNMDQELDEILAGDYRVEERIMLEAELFKPDGAKIALAYALNEAVVSQKDIFRIINVDVKVNGQTVDQMRCDGVIVSTPTGSTGYSLSAGGPVVLPTLDVLLITPVCAHTLASGNIVISGNDVVTICAASDAGCAALTLDGQIFFEIKPGELVRVKKADFAAQFIRLKEHNFFTLLKEKLTEWMI